MTNETTDEWTDQPDRRNTICDICRCDDCTTRPHRVRVIHHWYRWDQIEVWDLCDTCTDEDTHYIADLPAFGQHVWVLEPVTVGADS